MNESINNLINKLTRKSRTVVTFPLMAAVALSGSAVLVSGCSDNDYSRPPSHRSVYYDPYDYYYYPRTQVYFHITSGYYYYRDKHHWRHVRRLPPHFRLNHKDRVRVVIRDDKPYIRHHEHVRVFAPNRPRHDDWKKHKNREKYERKLHKQKHKENRRR